MDENNIIPFEEVLRRFNKNNEENTEKIKSIEKNTKTQNQDLKEVNKYLAKVIEDVNSYKEKEKGEREFDKEFAITTSNKISALCAIELNGIKSMAYAMEYMRNTIGGILGFNKITAQYCLKMSNSLNGIDNKLNSKIVNKLSGNKIEDVDYEVLDENGKVGFLGSYNDELPSLTNEIKYEQYPALFEGKSGNNVENLLGGFLGYGGSKNLKKYEEQYKVLDESKFGKRIKNALDPIGGNAKNLEELLKTTKKISKKKYSLVGSAILGLIVGLNNSIPLFIDEFKAFLGNMSFDNLTRVIAAGGLNVLIAGGALLAGAIGLGLQPSTNILMAIYRRMVTMWRGSNNVPIDGVGGTGGKGGKGVKGGRIRGIGGAITGIGAGLAIDYAFTKAGEAIAGEEGKNVGGAIGTTGGIVGGEVIHQGIKGGFKNIPKVLPSIAKTSGVLTAVASGIEAIGHLSDAATESKNGQDSNSTKSLIQAGISIAGPALGAAIGSFIAPGVGTYIGMTIGSGLSSVANALIDNTKATKENTENESLLNTENQVSDRIYKNQDVYKPIPTPTNDVVQNKEVEECLTSLNLNLSENRELINALAEKNDRVRMARDKWVEGGESQYKIDIDNKTLSTLSNMNENLKRICDNTKGETEIGFNFNS